MDEYVVRKRCPSWTWVVLLGEGCKQLSTSRVIIVLIVICPRLVKLTVILEDLDFAGFDHP